MRRLILAICLAPLVGCSTGVTPERTYVPTFCEVSEFESPSGDRIYIYVGGRGSVEMRIVDGSQRKVAEGK